jgi:hypothetical protein
MPPLLSRLSPAARPQKRAFALVSVLIMVVLLTFVLVALLSLLRMENQAGGNTILRNQAQQNALVGLDLALAEIQGNLGPDQRVSATAALLDSDPATETVENVAQPYWTGAWNAQRWDGGTQKFPTDYYDKQARFRKWLVSTPTTGGPDLTKMDAAKAPSLTETNSVVLVGEGTVKPAAGPKTEVRAWLRDGDEDAAQRKGRYAWWVGDEGVKARLNLQPVAKTATKDTLQANLAAAPRNALEAVEGFEAAKAAPEDLAKTLTYSTLPLAFQTNGTPTDFTRAFHDFTVYSSGVQSDTQRGGLKKDLSLALEMTKADAPDFIWDSAAGCYRKVYNRNAIAPATPAKADANAPEGPDWGLIHRHYNLYKRLKVDTDGVYIFETDPYNRLLRNELNVQGSIDPRNVHSDYILPLVRRTQLVFGLYKDKKYYWRADAATQPEVVYLSAYPALHLWNPYNVRLRPERPLNQYSSASSFNTIMQQVWTIPIAPLELSFDGGGTWRNMQRIYWEVNNTLFTLNFGGGFGSPKVPYEMEPGALAVYGPESQNPALIDRFYSGEPTHRDGAPVGRRSTDMRTGWDPLGPFHSFSLGTGTIGTAADAIETGSMGVVNFAARYWQPNQITRISLHRMLESEGSFTDSRLNVVGIHEFNAVGDTANPTLYKSYTATDFPQITAANLSNKNNPYYLFSYNMDFKLFPGETSLPSQYGFFSDPTEASYLMETENKVNALSSPFEITVTPLTGGPTTTDGQPHVKVDPAKSNRGYLGELSQGITNYTWKEIPTLPLTSLGQLQHVALGLDYGNAVYQSTEWLGGSGKQNIRPAPQTPFATFARPFTNSYAHPLLPADTAILTGAGNYSYDQCIHANYALADGYFLSTITPQTSVAFASKREVGAVLEQWLAGKTPLLNARFKPYLAPGQDAAQVANLLLNNNTIRKEAAARAAANLMAEGAFNINSLSEDAWVAILGANKGAEVPFMLANSSAPGVGVQLAAAAGFPVSRVTLPNGEAASATNPNGYWKGFSDLTQDQLRLIARYLVQEIKTRGPFLNLADFLSRELSTRAPQNKMGAVQAAIEAAKINDHSELTTRQVTSADLPPTGYQNSQAALGPVATGIPGYVTQADVLTPVLPFLSARSDTFTIRSYGEVLIKNKVQSRAWCEAVVQRTPDYVDPADKPEVAPAALTSDTNKTLGRRFRIIQFRWLSPDEV